MLKYLSFHILSTNSSSKYLPINFQQLVCCVGNREFDHFVHLLFLKCFQDSWWVRVSLAYLRSSAPRGTSPISPGSLPGGILNRSWPTSTESHCLFVFSFVSVSFFQSLSKRWFTKDESRNIMLPKSQEIYWFSLFKTITELSRVWKYIAYSHYTHWVASHLTMNSSKSQRQSQQDDVITKKHCSTWGWNASKKLKQRTPPSESNFSLGTGPTYCQCCRTSASTVNTRNKESLRVCTMPHSSETSPQHFPRDEVKSLVQVQKHMHAG